MQPGAKILIPRWIQLVGLPLILLFLWVVAGAVKHVLFLFIVALLIALFFDPIVRAVHGRWLPRGFAVAAVYLVTTIVVIAALAVAGTVVVTQAKRGANRFDDYFNKTHVYVSQGNYPGRVTLASGISLYGGYSQADGWKRSASFMARISSGAEADGRMTAVEGVDITAATTIDRLTIQSDDATSAGAVSGAVVHTNP